MSSVETAPLDGILVADLSRVLAGPYCTMLLADLGATVIKVESAGGDDTRAWTPPDKDGISTYFLSINRNKRSIVMDFRDPDDMALVHELFRRADVAIENFKPGALAKFGLDHDRARAINPALIYASISGFGTAEGAGLPGYDLVVPGRVGADEPHPVTPTARPSRAGISVVRRHHRAPRHHRHPGRAAPPQRHRRGPTRGAEPCCRRHCRAW